MELKIELSYFSISLFEGTIKDKLLDKADFIKWLKSHSLFEIKEFPLWIYAVNEKEYHFRLARVNYKDWNAFKTEEQHKTCFSFTCNKGIEFINDFEKKFKEFLGSPNLHNTR